MKKMDTISFEDHLTKRLGPIGTPERDAFEQELHEWEAAEERSHSKGSAVKTTHQERQTNATRFLRTQPNAAEMV